MAVVGGERSWVASSSNVAALRQIFGARPTAGDSHRLAPNQMLLSSDTAKARRPVGRLHRAGAAVRGDARTYTVSGIYESTQLTNPVVLPPEAARDFSVPQPIQGFIQLATGASVAAVQPQVESLLADSRGVGG